MIGDRVSHVAVRTPEGVRFAFPLAGPFARFLAWFIDALVISTAGTVVLTVVRLLTPISGDVAQALAVAGYFVVSTGYGIVLEWAWRGQTLGKRVVRLRVLDAEGLPLTLSQVVLRNLLRAIDVLPVAYLVGGAAMMLSPRAQRLGDLAAGTIVARHRRVREPDFEQLFQGRFNSLRTQPHLAARLRQQVPPMLAAAALAALLRREQLEPAARVRLFGEMAAALRRIVPYPAELIAGMPDETYVRNVVEIVHAPAAPAEPATHRGAAAVSG